MSNITLFVALVAIACIFWSPAKVLAVITLALIAAGNIPVAIGALLFLAALYYFIKIRPKRK
jgi:hypothetical protein